MMIGALERNKRGRTLLLPPDFFYTLLNPIPQEQMTIIEMALTNSPFFLRCFYNFCIRNLGSGNQDDVSIGLWIAVLHIL